MKQYISDGKTPPEPNQYFFYKNKYWMGVTGGIFPEIGSSCTEEKRMYIYYVSLWSEYLRIDQGTISLHQFLSEGFTHCEEHEINKKDNTVARDRIECVKNIDNIEELLILLKLQEL